MGKLDLVETGTEPASRRHESFVGALRGLTFAVFALSSLPVENFHGHTSRRSRWLTDARRKLLASEGGGSEERIWQGVELRHNAKSNV